MQNAFFTKASGGLRRRHTDSCQIVRRTRDQIIANSPKASGGLGRRRPVLIAPVPTIQLVSANLENTVFSTALLFLASLLHYDFATLLHTTDFITFYSHDAPSSSLHTLLPPPLYDFSCPCERRFYELPFFSPHTTSNCCNAEESQNSYCNPEPKLRPHRRRLLPDHTYWAYCWSLAR